MNKKSIKRVVGFISLVLVSAFFIGNRLLFFTPGGSLERSSSYLVYPVLKMQNAVVTPLKQYFQARKTERELSIQLAKLQKERDAALAKNIELQSLVDYSQDIAELVDFKKKYLSSAALITQVIAKHFSEIEHYFLLDAGQKQGIHKDMVALYNNCIVGKVVEVYPWYCKLMLITDKNCKIAALCTNTKALGIYEGTNELTTARLGHVSHLSKLAYEDLVLSSGEGLVFPKGFGIGKIRSYQVQGLFYTVTVEPLIDVKSLAYCTLIDRDKCLTIMTN